MLLREENDGGGGREEISFVGVTVLGCSLSLSDKWRS